MPGRCGGEKDDPRGYKVARGRDRVSSYLSGKSIPDPKNMAAMADALGVTMEELAPNVAVDAIARENPEIAMTVISGHPDKVHLVINKIISMDVVVQILSILNAAP